MSTSSAERSDAKTKKRSDMACTSCRRRKLKCENKDSTPPCKRCHHDKAVCEFVPVAEDRQDRNSKTPSGSRGSSEDCKSNSQPAISPPIQATPAPPRRIDRPMDSGVTVPPPTNYTSGLPMRHSSSGYNDVPHQLSHSIPEQVRWPDTPIYLASSGRYDHINQIQGPYIYSPPLDPSYSHPAYVPDQHPRAMISPPPGPPYYNHPSTHQAPQPHYQSYTASQEPSGLVGYVDPNTPHGHSCDNSHFCGPYSR